MDGAAPTPVSGRVWHQWLRVSRLIIGLRSTVRDTATWSAAKAVLLDAIKERSKVQRAGWFN